MKFLKLEWRSATFAEVLEWSGGKAVSCEWVGRPPGEKSASTSLLLVDRSVVVIESSYHVDGRFSTPPECWIGTRVPETEPPQD